MQSLNDLFGNVKAAIAQKTAEKQDILNAIGVVVPEALTIKCRCEVRNKVLHIQTHPALKNKIMMRQAEVIAATKKWGVERVS